MPGNPVGIGVVDAFRRNLAHLIDQQNAASGSMTGVPSGIIKIKTKEVSQTQADLTKSQWLEVFAKGVRAPAVLGENMDFTPISFNAQESQFIESRQMGIAETAFMFGLDPADVAASVGGQSLTYANLDSRNIDRITNSFGGWIRRIEEGLSSLLPGNQAAKLPVEKLLRTETKNRYEAYGLALTGGWMTVDEVRALENLAPLQVAAA
jgi:HK97 family phage portal protein